MLLVALARIDLREGRLPDRLTMPLAVLGLALAAHRVGRVPAPELVGALVGFGVFWVLGEGHHRLRGEDALGLGDAKLLGAAGAWLGWRDLAPLVLIAALGALAWAALARGRDPRPPRGIAFGPWLALAFIVLWLLRLAGLNR